ncbi:MAG: hypothetical protein IKK47_01115 [Ruminococcus sp.]|nr:hypothetical protein [Ruminococcus sp.]
MYLYDSGPKRFIEDIFFTAAAMYFFFFFIYPACFVWFIAAAIQCFTARKEYKIVKDFNLDNSKYIMVKGEYTNSVDDGLFTYLQYIVDDRTYNMKIFGYIKGNPCILYRASSPKKYILYDFDYHKRRCMYKIMSMVASVVVIAFLLILTPHIEW